ncbi:LysR family transcriptional regulator [Catenovulum sp. SM1970]|uniref:LysR family transcriptional regulator n=1 Tax=Marinifaba aquimaris TaxID=2741323 RepID=UPI0015718A1E|nr:LysR family transcriptional regulator [Marinifaba aquimaris]NTS76840.1 LysR family transcriptional regulator [Marinifaba aquimaris]
MRTTLEQWRMLKAVIDHGGFAHASEAIYKSQSSINTAVHKLQDTLGVRLLEVQGRKAVLTEQGKLLLRRAEMLIADAEKIEDVAASLGQGVEAEIRIAVDMAYPDNKLHHALTQLSERYPQTSIELFETVLGGSNEMLKKDEVAIAIATHIDEDIETTRLCTVEFLCVAAPNHPLFDLESVSYQDLKRYRQIVVRDSASNREINAGWLGAEQRWTVDNILTSLRLLKKGLGYANIPMHLAEDEIAAGRLKVLNIRDKNESKGDLVLACKDTELLGPAAQYLYHTLQAQEKMG